MLKGYIYIARMDHWFKNIFMLPGVALAFVLTNVEPNMEVLLNMLVAILSTCFIASANYVINEWLDAPFYHSQVVQQRSHIGRYFGGWSNSFRLLSGWQPRLGLWWRLL